MLAKYYGKLLHKEVESNKRIFVLDCDLGKCFNTGDLFLKYPSRVFNLGIAEQNAISIAAGIAALPFEFVPFINTFAIFAVLRGGDQLRNSVCFNNLNVKIVCTKIGFMDDQGGASHQSIEDVGIAMSIPNLTILSPCTKSDLIESFEFLVNHKGPVYLRLGSGEEDIFPIERCGIGYQIYRYGCDYVIFATIDTIKIAINASDYFKEKGIQVAVIALTMYKPLDSKRIIELVYGVKGVIVIEIHNVLTGIGTQISKILLDKYPVKISLIGINDCFTESGNRTALYKKYCITEENIIDKIETFERGDKH